MRVFITCVLIVGIAVLLVIGLLRVVRDLFSESVIAAPSSANEEGEPRRAENAGMPSAIASDSTGNWTSHNNRFC